MHFPCLIAELLPWHHPVVVSPWWTAIRYCTSLTSPRQVKRGENMMEKGSGLEIRTGNHSWNTITSKADSQAKQTQCKGDSCTLLTITKIWEQSESECKLKTLSLHPSSSSSSPQAVQGNGPSIMLHYLPWSVSVPAPRGSCVGFLQSAALPALPQHSSVQWCPPFRSCSTWVALGDRSPWLHGEICSVWCPWAAGDGLLLCGPIRGCRELRSWSTSCPPPALTLVRAGLFSYITHSSLPGALVQQFFPFLNVLSIVDHSSALVAVCPFEAVGAALLWHEAVLGHSCSPPSITTLPCKPNTLLFCYPKKTSTFKILKCATTFTTYINFITLFFIYSSVLPFHRNFCFVFWSVSVRTSVAFLFCYAVP